MTVLVRAQAGDENAFRELTAPYFRELHLHCYRMLGSVTDADDVMQEILLAAWRGLDGFAGRSSVRTWLYRIATNRCLNAIRDSKRRPPVEPVPPFDPPAPSRRSEVTWLQPYPDEWLHQLADSEPGPETHAVRRENVELAFIAALQRMPPKQAAALLLVDVLGFATTDVADLMDTSPTAIKGALQRARASLRTSQGSKPADAPSRANSRSSEVPDATNRRGSEIPDAAAERQLARRFAEAFVADDIDAITSMLTDDAWLTMPPAPHEYYGPPAIAAFLHASAEARTGSTLQFEEAGANLQPAFHCYFVDQHHVRRYAGRLVLGIRSDHITHITRFLGPAPATRITQFLGPAAEPS
ncbi:sigma-70 family RNA polymerase sigma factor [Kribbella qitaiheensis]|uniref:Sigma-70 family RNA polymerase sigma factor n=1 Tax=Kribbella qitaiheensis TaxID=1544730 RepID=A0A7G6X781_9ACTN|nr:RNA polymerase subunit sigma-70 [Kribbella qitaiheensis]QNE22096.1 sigma-70 family RNA polymerase sigma factor [Kribbella qitaiheensis]